MRIISYCEDKVDRVLKQYWQNRPLFLVFIRAKEAELFQRYLPFKGLVLDFGCGDGFFARVVFDKVDAGVDLADSRIEEAREKESYRKLVVYDGKRLPFPDKSYSTVVSNCVFEHLPDLDQALEEIYRVLKPSGKLLVTVMSHKWERYLIGGKIFGRNYCQWLRRKQKHQNLLSSKNWKKKFLERGFKIEYEEAYLGESASKFVEIIHYLSLPDLFSYLLFKKWVLFPIMPFSLVKFSYNRFFSREVSLEEGSAIFYVLSKS